MDDPEHKRSRHSYFGDFSDTSIYDDTNVVEDDEDENLLEQIFIDCFFVPLSTICFIVKFINNSELSVN